MKEDLRIVKLLLENGANPNFANYRMITPLAFAASKGNHEICKILLDHEADASIKTNDGETPLDWARRKNFTQIMNLLQEHQKSTSIDPGSPVESAKLSRSLSAMSIEQRFQFINSSSGIAFQSKFYAEFWVWLLFACCRYND